MAATAVWSPTHHLNQSLNNLARQLFQIGVQSYVGDEAANNTSRRTAPT